MASKAHQTAYNRDVFIKEARTLLSVIEDCANLETARRRLRDRVAQMSFDRFRDRAAPAAHELIRVRDCAQALSGVLEKRSDQRTGFSVAQALWDIATGKPRQNLEPAFFAELIQWIRGLQGLAPFQYLSNPDAQATLTGREAAIFRSEQLDKLWATIQSQMDQFDHGLTDPAQQRRELRKQHILKTLNATDEDWHNWKWHTRNVITDAETLSKILPITQQQKDVLHRTSQQKLPFGITPYYASLMDDDDTGRDRAIRMQVIPPADYVDHMARWRDQQEHSYDFMLEADTSPIDLITRRYPAIVILKPYNSCPQICVYCQRNWEINQPMAPNAMAGKEAIENAMQWIEKHPAIREVLITGGDPFMLTDNQVERLLARLAVIPHVDVIRIGTRTPVTLPMRITENLVRVLAKFRQIIRRDISIVTHIEHPYEITLDTARAVDLLRRAGIGVYNQQVYTFYVSRRFETASLRMLLKRIGVDPYYTFVPKGKEETNMYRVPLARILQEQKEEARLIPGMRRTDEAVYNVPGLGKNYIRARQHRDLLTVMPNGSRVYEFHPWEMNVSHCQTYLATDVPILDYLLRLQEIGENIQDYGSIWFYF